VQRQKGAAMSSNFDQYYTFGDLYETLEACSQLDMLLSRVRRQKLMRDEDVTAGKQSIEGIRAMVESYLNSSNLVPRGPSLA
jgi:hypothetical protein